MCCPALHQAGRVAVSRLRPPLAASPGVWARREAPTGRLQPGGWPTAAHLAAAAREREFWAKVGALVWNPGAYPVQPRCLRLKTLTSLQSVH